MGCSSTQPPSFQDEYPESQVPRPGASSCRQVPWLLGFLLAAPRSQMRPHPRRCPWLRCTPVCTHVITESWTPGQARPVKCLSEVCARAAWALVSCLTSQTGRGGSREAITCPSPGGAACTRVPKLPTSCLPQGQAGTGSRGAQGPALDAGPVPAARAGHGARRPRRARLRPPARPSAQGPRPPARPPAGAAGPARPSLRGARPARPHLTVPRWGGGGCGGGGSRLRLTQKQLLIARAAREGPGPGPRRRGRRRSSSASLTGSGGGGGGGGARPGGGGDNSGGAPDAGRAPGLLALALAPGVAAGAPGWFGREDGAGTPRPWRPEPVLPPNPNLPAPNPGLTHGRAADPGLTEPAGGLTASLRPSGSPGLLEPGTPVSPPLSWSLPGTSSPLSSHRPHCILDQS